MGSFIVMTYGLNISYGPFASRDEAVEWAKAHVCGKYTIHVMFKPHSACEENGNVQIC